MSLGQPVMMRLARAHISGFIHKGLLEGFFAVWFDVGMMDSNIQWKVWAWPGTELRECVWYDHFFTWSVMDCEIVSL